MTSAPGVHIGENSPEEVAYKLFRHIVDCEKKSLVGSNANGFVAADRDYILTTYARALDVVRHPGQFAEE